jgi:hypothetical protein
MVEAGITTAWVKDGKKYFTTVPPAGSTQIFGYWIVNWYTLTGKFGYKNAPTPSYLLQDDIGPTGLNNTLVLGDLSYYGYIGPYIKGHRCLFKACNPKVTLNGREVGSGRSISGVVLNEGAIGVGGISVFCTGFLPTSTGADGSYSFSDAKQGRFELELGTEGGRTNPPKQVVDVVDSVTGVDFVMLVDVPGQDTFKIYVAWFDMMGRFAGCEETVLLGAQSARFAPEIISFEILDDTGRNVNTMLVVHPGTPITSYSTNVDHGTWTGEYSVPDPFSFPINFGNLTPKVGYVLGVRVSNDVGMSGPSFITIEATADTCQVIVPFVNAEIPVAPGLKVKFRKIADGVFQPGAPVVPVGSITETTITETMEGVATIDLFNGTYEILVEREPVDSFILARDRYSDEKIASHAGVQTEVIGSHSTFLEPRKDSVPDALECDSPREAVFAY